MRISDKEQGAIDLTLKQLMLKGPLYVLSRYEFEAFKIRYKIVKEAYFAGYEQGENDNIKLTSKLVKTIKIKRNDSGKSD